MSNNLATYFDANRYHGKWTIGDRVHGVWNKIPFVGTVGNDTLISEREGPRVSVHLDLPFKHQGKVYNFLFVKPKELKVFK
jgi:hypothetical protein